MGMVSSSLLFVFVVGGLGFELCVFVAGWRHALRSEWPFIIIIIYGIIITINRRSGITSHTSHGRKTGTRSMQGIRYTIDKIYMHTHRILIRRVLVN